MIAWHRCKLTGLLILIVMTMFGHRCDDPPPNNVNQTPPAGNGAGDYYIEYASTQEYFYCAANSVLQVWIGPQIDPSYQGFNRLFFTLDGPGGLYRSNYMDFSSSTTGSKVPEFGGSIPGGTYTVKGYMANIQENCGNDSNIYWRAESAPAYVDVIPCSSPEKTMTIEYGYQTSDTSAVYSYDLFRSPRLAEYIDIAFNPGNTKYVIIEGLAGLSAALVSIDKSALMTYIKDQRIYTNTMYLCGVKGFMDIAGNYLPYIVGMTTADTSSYIPNENTGSLVAFHTCMTVAKDMGADYNDYINKATIHELGHQRAFTSHSGHESVYCVMNQGAEQQYGSIKIGRAWNPMFCWRCIDSLKNVSW